MCDVQSKGEDCRMTYNNSVLPSKYDKLIDLCCKIPASSDVAGYKYAKSEDGKGVHSSPLSRTCPLLRFCILEVRGFDGRGSPRRERRGGMSESYRKEVPQVRRRRLD